MSLFCLKVNLIYFFFNFSGGELYSGTVSDFSGTDALIYRNPLRTEQYDLKHLNCKYNFSECLIFILLQGHILNRGAFNNYVDQF